MGLCEKTKPTTDVPESDGENETKLKNTLQDTFQGELPQTSKTGHSQIQEIQRTPQDTPQEEQPQDK